MWKNDKKLFCILARTENCKTCKDRIDCGSFTHACWSLESENVERNGYSKQLITYC